MSSQLENSIVSQEEYIVCTGPNTFSKVVIQEGVDKNGAPLVDVTSTSCHSEINVGPQNSKFALKEEDGKVQLIDLKVSGWVPAVEVETEDKGVKDEHQKYYGCSDINVNQPTFKTRHTFTCNECPFETTKRKIMKDHKMCHKPNRLVTEKMYNCKLCLFQTKLYSVYNNHTKFHSIEGKLTSCSQCNYQAVGSGTVRRHYAIAHEPFKLTEYSCQKCSFKSRFQCVVKRHQIVHLGPTELAMSCYKCEFIGESQQELTEHTAKYRNSTFKCGYCDFRSVQRDVLKRHLAARHGIYRDGLSDYSRESKCDLLVDADTDDSVKIQRNDEPKSNELSLGHKSILHIKLEHCYFATDDTLQDQR